MPATRSKSKLAASKKAKKRVNDSTKSSNNREVGVSDQGEEDLLDTPGQMRQNLSEAEHVRGLETDRIHSADTSSSDENIGSQQSHNPSHSSFDHTTNVQQNVIIVEMDGISISMSTQEFLSFKQRERESQEK